MDTVYFFGYGANRNREKLRQILGKYPELEFGGIIEGYQLCFQTLDQIPKGPKEVLQKLYGDSFKGYTLKKGEGVVGGAVFQLEKKDFEYIKEWEFVGMWRELIPVTVKTAGGKAIQALTEKAMNDTVISDVVDGLLYDEFSFVETKEKQKEFYTKEQLTYIRQQLNVLHA